jgi:hypothetical protein
MELLLKKHCDILFNNKNQNYNTDENISCFRNVCINKNPNTSYNPNPIIVDKFSSLDNNNDSDRTTLTNTINPVEFHPMPCLGRYSFDFVDRSKCIVSSSR